MLPFNPHPPIVMFASSLGSVCLLFELLALRFELLFTKPVRFTLLTLFLLASIFSYYSGFYGADFAVKLPQDLLKTHQGYARFGLIVLLATYFIGAIALLTNYSTKGLLWFYRTVLAIVVGVIIYTSHLGGQIVFEHGGGVRGSGYDIETFKPN